VPLRPRCTYAAVLPRSLPGSMCQLPQEFPAQPLGGYAPLPAQIHQVRAGAASRGCHTSVPRVLLSIPLAGPRPSGSTGPFRLCQGCSHPPRHHPDQAALSSTAPLRRDQRRRSLTSTRTTAPHGARTRCGTRSSPPPWTPGCRCGTCRKPPRTPTRAPRCATTGPTPRWTGTPSSLPTSPEPPGSTQQATHPPGREQARRMSRSTSPLSQTVMARSTREPFCTADSS
jgi:hypothetical protein